MGILHKKVTDFNSTFSSLVIPEILIKCLLHASHYSLGHAGATNLYHFIKSFITSQTCEKGYINTLKTAKNVKS